MSNDLSPIQQAQDIVASLFVEGLSAALNALATTSSQEVRAAAAATIPEVLRSPAFVMRSPDERVLIQTATSPIALDSLYALWVDVMDGKDRGGASFELRKASPLVRIGFMAIVLAPKVERARLPEEIYGFYGVADGKPFARLNKQVKRAWYAVAAALARVNDYPDPQWSDETANNALSVSEVVAAVEFVAPRFGSPSLGRRIEAA
jgi:hypothetical protein